MPYLADQEKEYRATVRLGVTTDTQDLSGRVLTTAAVPPLAREAIEHAVRRFVGPIRQVPPMYSALHHEGRRLYELAREGREVERQAREVVVHSIAVEAIDDVTVTLRIVCGKGTYIRVLAADLGAGLGCGGAIQRLVRLRVGPFDLDTTMPSPDLGTTEREALLARLLPSDAALATWPVVRLDEREAAAFVHGQQIAVPTVDGGAQFVRVRDRDEAFLGVGRVGAGRSRVRPERVVHADRSGTRVRSV